MSKPQVLFIGEPNRDLPEFHEFSAQFECIHYKITSKETLLEDLQGKLSKVVAIYGSWLGFHPVGGLTEDIVQALPDSLKLVTSCSVGLDGWGSEQLAKRGIKLYNCPSLGAEQVADLVLYHTLQSFRYFKVFEDNFRESGHTVKTRSLLQSASLDKQTGKVVLNSTDSSDYAFGHRLGDSLPILTPFGKNAVVVGFGSIGSRIAKRLHAIGMNISYVKRTRLSSEQEAQLLFPVKYYASLKEAAPVADLVVLSLPGTSETENLYNKEIIDLVPHRSRVINVGRGTIVNEDDLLAGLRSGKLSFAGLDVYAKEPAVSRELIERQDVILTPHIGSSTVENFNDTSIFCLRNIQDVILYGKEGLSRVN
ncbi:Putative hydroxyacid dehydrogenases [Komagataella phaffii CBS 7435]|uniref:2-hydroxyacid dehydrogenase n=2 Tax=Komagataella phaffii TaxID=460519 RepID=C4R0F6_KOMPG|nr:uncharacterized protein PAS_chr2-1_0360 [Komagataella phaffii GS115]AOA62797.1 GQ67_00398T0 [Komagataella phaffii]CAH2448504.1 Putative hydroxyacid dehydrogenases [Komagataella phaffii CBS 7435]AOA67744.1 GQ68_00991T0 [Komagataella phaffii GS115]CAY68980.1 Putative protein with sequence similarity to hydroxyacid dehydrogenases [Komagataella phaffii GS115]CCA38621.1 Putative hydroxyacid dehydrogenases [Komagataella phaffii CBS 7435]